MLSACANLQGGGLLDHIFYFVLKTHLWFIIDIVKEGIDEVSLVGSDRNVMSIVRYHARKLNGTDEDSDEADTNVRVTHQRGERKILTQDAGVEMLTHTHTFILFSVRENVLLG